MKRKSVKILIYVLAGVGLLAVIVWLIPLDSWRMRLEVEASRVLGQPVRVERLNITILPYPAAVVRGVTIGDKGQLRIGRLGVVPELLALPRGAMELRHVDVSDVSGQAEFLGTVIPKGGGTDPPGLAVREIRLNRVQLSSGTSRLPAFGGTVKLDEANRLSSARFATDDGAAELTAVPFGQGTGLALKARNWTLPVDPRLRFETLKGEGQLLGSDLSLPSVQATMYGGSASADAALSWSDGVKLSGSVKAHGVDLDRLLQDLLKQKSLGGKLETEASFSASARRWDGLADAIRANGRFSVGDGVLRKVDLAGAATLVGAKEAGGGGTRFDTLSGSYRIRGRAYHIDNLVVSSGTLNATGNVVVSPAKELGGRVAVELKKGMSLARVPLAVSGTVDNPVVLPSGAAVAGAAVGTTILGPGLGTAAGMRAGEAIEKIFGGGK